MRGLPNRSTDRQMGPKSSGDVPKAEHSRFLRHSRNSEVKAAEAGKGRVRPSEGMVQYKNQSRLLCWAPKKYRQMSVCFTLVEEIG